MIPRIIHIVWVGHRLAPMKWIDTWREKHPNWGFILWDNNLVDNYDFKNRKNINKFMQEKKYHGVADIVRYEAVYDMGGVALPADAECINAIDELLEKVDLFTCYENEVHYPGRLMPIIGANKNNEFVGRLVDGLVDKYVEEPWIDTGNMYLTEEANKWKGDIKIYPGCFFAPNHRLGDNWDGQQKIYAYQYSGTTFGLYDKL